MANEYAGFDVVRDYGAGQVSVETFLHVCRSYQGPDPHFLLSVYDDENTDYILGADVFRKCLRLPEEKLYALLEALVAESPHVLTLAHRSGGLLSLALRFGPQSHRIFLLLAVPGGTRLLDRDQMTPLHVACSKYVGDPALIHLLIDLDPDVLTLPDRDAMVPLHYSLSGYLAGCCTHVPRMIELRPETLHLRDNQGQTPLSRAMGLAPPSSGAALLPLAEQHPLSLLPPDAALRSATALMAACHWHGHLPELVRAVLVAHPPSLVIPDRRRPWDPLPCLPFEAVSASRPGGGELPAYKYVRDETVHMALAVAEYVLGLNSSAVTGEDAQAEAADNVAWFQGHVKDTLQERWPGVPVEQASGLSVAQALLRNRRSDDMTALVRAWFVHDRAVELLRGDGRLLRNALLGETVVDLYQLNRRGRRWPVALHEDAGAEGDDYSSSSAAARHQVELLGTLRDSVSVESTYLQFREVSHHALLAGGRRRLDPD